MAQSQTLGSPAKTGIKKEIDDLYARFQEHDDAMARLDGAIEKNATMADESIKAVQSSLKASLASLRDEMTRKFSQISIEIAQLQKAVNVQRSEQSILAQQQKDNSKKIDGVAATVSELIVDVRSAWLKAARRALCSSCCHSLQVRGEEALVAPSGY